MKGIKKSYLIIGGILLLIFFNGCSSYNSMVTKEEGVTAQWQQVEVAYQARMDKTKNLFKIVQSAANFEKKTLKDVIDARSNATKIQINVDDLTEENLAKFQEAQEQFGRSLGRLMAVAESYPDLKAVKGFQDFQAQYEGMENRIATERVRFNEMGRDYNTYIRRFPKNIWAMVFSFKAKPYFQSDKGAENAPDIEVLE
ncbi:MAG: LemA family protein [Flavobacteriia bacterium]|nr:LemA family protein [Flavobacteriia bacterium]